MSAGADLSGRHTDAPGREGWVAIRKMIEGVLRTVSISPPPRGMGGSRGVSR